MDRLTAFHLLGLKDQVSPPQLQEAFDGKRTQLEQRLSDAPTDGLKSKYRQELSELQQAFEVASGAGRDAVAGLSATMVRDLPGARPVYTQDYGSHEPAAGARLTLSEGQVLADRYEVRRKLGAGGMGAVFAALDRNREQEIAVKVLLPGLLRDPQARQRFMDEAKLSADLSHPHIVNVYDVQKDGDLHFITMELLEGRTLRQEMETRKQLKKPFTVEEVKSLASQMCEALSYAHKTTVHRDVKPENIWLQPDDNVKLMDFGIARLLSTSQLTMTGTSMGTAYYMAPEQLKGSKNVDGRADQYALAAVMYEMLTGEVPAGVVKSPHQINKQIPVGFASAVMKGLSSKADDRYPEIDSFGRGLGSVGRRIRVTSARMKISVGVTVVLAVILASIPLWKGLLVDQWRSLTGADLAFKDKASELQGQANSLLDLSKQKVADISERLRVAQQHNDQTDAAFLQHVQQLTEAVEQGPHQIEAAGKLKLGEDAIREQRYEHAVTALTAAVQDLQVLADAPNEAEAALRKQQEVQQAIQSMPTLGLIANSLDSVKKAKVALDGQQSKADGQLVVGQFADATRGYDQMQIAIGNVSDAAKRGLMDLAKADANEQSGQLGLATLNELLSLDPGNSEALALEQSILSQMSNTALAEGKNVVAMHLAAHALELFPKDSNARQACDLATKKVGKSAECWISSGLLHCLAVKCDGGVAAWGSNQFGQCNVPAGLQKVMAVSAGAYQSLALKSDGTVVMWGDNSQEECNAPTALAGVIAISAGGTYKSYEITTGYMEMGYAHCLALTQDGKVVAWGNNQFGQCSVPEDLKHVIAIAAGGTQSLALKDDGTVVAWGDNQHGECNVPPQLESVLALSAGVWISTALKSDGTVVQWGNNHHAPAGLRNIVGTTTTNWNSYFLMSDGTVLGDAIPTGLNKTIAISASNFQCLALNRRGKIRVWGNNAFGQCDVPADLIAGPEEPK